MAKIVLEEHRVYERVMPNIEKASKNIKNAASYSKRLSAALPNEVSSSNIKYKIPKITNRLNNIDIHLTRTKHNLVEKLEKTKRIELKSKNRINELSNAILKAASTISGTTKKIVKSKKESKLVAKILEQAKLKKEKKTSKFSSIFKKKFPSITGTLTGASIAAIIGGLDFKPDKTPEGELKRKIRRNAKNSKSIEQLVSELNKMNYMTEAEKASRNKSPKTSFWLNVFQPSSRITVDGNTYVFKNGKCCRIEYKTGIVTRITYHNDEIRRVTTRGSGKNNNVDIFGEYNVDNEQYGGNQTSMRDNVDKLLEDPIVLKMLKKAYPPTRKADNYVNYLNKNALNLFKIAIDLNLSPEKFENKYGFPKEYLTKRYNVSDARQASRQSSLEDYELYLKKISSSGCGYTAIVNTLFKEYEGREREFEEKFGYPMYTTKADGSIDYNYEYVIIDTFTEVWKDSDEYTFDEIVNSMNGSSGTDNSISGETTEASTGTDDAVVEKVEKIFEEKYDIDTDMERITIYNSKNDSDAEREDAISEIKKLARAAEKDDSKHVVLAAGGYKLYDMDGDFCMEGKGHAMYITDVTPKGDIIVSSWGKQYVVKLDDATRIGYYEVEYN